MKKQITEEMGIHKEWYKKATDSMTMGEVNDFIKDLKYNYTHDYGTVCHAIAASALAVMWSLSKFFGITGFQAGAVMWEIIMKWKFRQNKLGVRLVDLDEFLYPQYDYKFEKVMPNDTFKKMQEEAKRLIAGSSEDTNESVLEHWHSIADGKVPFGYRLECEE